MDEKRGRRAVRSFRVIWTSLPADEVIVAAGAAALRMQPTEQTDLPHRADERT